MSSTVKQAAVPEESEARTPNPTSVKSSVAVAVTEAMRAAGQTQLALSDHTGIPRTTLIRRLNGHSAFTVDELWAIAGFLNVEPASLLPEPSAVA